MYYSSRFFYSHNIKVQEQKMQTMESRDTLYKKCRTIIPRINTKININITVGTIEAVMHNYD